MEAIEVQSPVPTSVMLAQLLLQAPTGSVNLAWIISHLKTRSFGILLLALSILSMAPGIASFSGFIVAIPAIEMILGRDRPTLPRFVAERNISAEKFSRWVSRAIPLCRILEKLVRPRLHMPFKATKRLVGLGVLFLAMMLLAPFPFNILPAFAIMLISIAYL